MCMCVVCVLCMFVLYVCVCFVCAYVCTCVCVCVCLCVCVCVQNHNSITLHYIMFPYLTPTVLCNVETHNQNLCEDMQLLLTLFCGF